MILTKDNILRFVKEKKAVTPTIIAENFDTSTMIASAALSELAKDKLIGITEFKLSSSPYYYDFSQIEYLYELGLKHFKGYEKEILIKLKEQEVLNLNSLSIQESLAIERIKDFAKPLQIDASGKELKFYVWYLRNLAETKKQIQNAISGNNNSETKSTSQKKTKVEIKKPKPIPLQQIPKSQPTQNRPQNQQQTLQQNYSQPQMQHQYNQSQTQQQPQFQPKELKQNQTENFIENYFRQNYLQVESKIKDEKSINYTATLQINRINVTFDCIYYMKKPTEFDVITFYSSSVNPKIVFLENAAKKFFKMSENLKNLTIINI